jgi:hypothetical protein
MTLPSISPTQLMEGDKKLSKRQLGLEGTVSSMFILSHRPSVSVLLPLTLSHCAADGGGPEAEQAPAGIHWLSRHPVFNYHFHNDLLFACPSLSLFPFLLGS